MKTRQFAAYLLHFPGPLHISNTRDDYGVSLHTISSDTLYAALTATLAKMGKNIPADGVIIRGDSRINESLLTGESKPVAKQVGDEVIGGSTNGEGVLYIEVKELGEKSYIS